MAFLFVLKYVLSTCKTLFLESCIAWNYTTLKLSAWWRFLNLCLTTIWNYTTLKQTTSSLPSFKSLTTIWNYTTLKRIIVRDQCKQCLTTIWNYTTLKLSILVFVHNFWLNYHMKLHYSQTNENISKELVRLNYHMKLHYSQTRSLF